MKCVRTGQSLENVWPTRISWWSIATRLVRVVMPTPLVCSRTVDCFCSFICTAYAIAVYLFPLSTSRNSPTLLSTGPLLSLCATSTTTAFLHIKQFYSNLISSSHNPKRLWQIVNKFLHRKSSSPLPSCAQVSLSPTALLPSSQTKYPTSACLSLATPLHHLHTHPLLPQHLPLLLHLLLNLKSSRFLE